MLRGLVISQLGKYGHPEVIAECKKRFEGHVIGSVPLASDLRNGVFSATLASGDESTFDALMQVSLLCVIII